MKRKICRFAIIKLYRKDIKKNIDDVIKSIEEKFNYPLFVKPANLGSSVGISKAHDNKELIEALMEACKYDRKIVIEEYVPCREIEVGVIGNDEPMASAVGEIIASKEFYDYEAKYLDGGKSEIRIPADITESQKNRIRNMAINAYKALDCCGFSRVDFFINKETGEILINEINTIPGFTRYSMFPLLWKEAGIEYSKLIDMLIEYGFERYNDRG
ncbi:MAG: D-alanine--D-alanine ligase [Clostridiales bacterium]|nr:D-alanine--D-alanine ligase [Clostridiales bacterium]